MHYLDKEKQKRKIVEKFRSLIWMNKKMKIG